jgi:large repetitive protein
MRRSIEDTPLNLTDIVIADSATATATLTLSDAAAGALTTGTSGVVTSTYDSATGIWSASGAIADVNALLAAVTFTPAENFNGSLFIATSVSDDAGTATGSKLITGTAVNDAPVAFNDLVAGVEDIVIAGAVLGNDTDVDGDALTASVVSAPANGTVTLDTATGAFVYTPAANFNGTDSFTYQANDGTADSNVATVTLTVTPINDAPIAVDDTYTTNENTALTVAAGAILANDSDVDGDALTVFPLGGQTLHGFLVLFADGAFTYTPDANFNGTDSFTYLANDGTADSNVATVTLTVSPVTHAATAVKFVNGQDVNDVVAGSTVIFTYVVTNNGTVPLADVVVTDDKLGPITTFTGDANGDSLLDLTETWTYTQTATALAGQQTNVGTVTAQAGITVTAQDQACNPQRRPDALGLRRQRLAFQSGGRNASASSFRRAPARL